MMLATGFPRILYDILSADILQGSTRQYASELCFFLSTDGNQYMFNQSGSERKSIFNGIDGPLKSLPDIARTNKFDNMKKVLRKGQFVHHVDVLEISDEESSRVSLSALGFDSKSNVVKTAGSPANIATDTKAEESDDSDDDTLFSDVSTNIFDKYASKAFVPYRIDDHNMAKLDALFHGKKEQDIVALPDMSFLSNFGFEDAADIEDLKNADNEASGVGNFDTGSIGSSLSSDTRSRAFSVLSDYDLGTNSYSGIHEGVMAKTAPAMNSVRFATNDGLNTSSNTNMLKRMDPTMSRSANFAVHTASAAAYVSNARNAHSSGANLPKMHSNTHYRNIKTASSASLFRIGESSNSPRLPVIHRSTAGLSKLNENLLEDSQLQQVSMAYSIPISIPPASPTIPREQFDQTQQQLNSDDRSFDHIDDFMSALDPLALSGFNSTNRNISFQSTSNPRGDDNNDEEDDSDEERDSKDDASAGAVASKIVEPDTTNPFIYRKMQRIRAEQLVDHSFMKRVLHKKVSIAETQNLVERIESVLKLMDSQDTGFVSWECFARVLLAIAPPKLLREDVVEFMQAQTDSDQNLVDYREFVISGKVMIVERQREASGDQPQLYVKGWLERQKQFSGEPSTLTWKAHVQWYQQRKATAIVWLMRRAARAIRQSVRLQEADKYLRVLGKQAKVLAELLAIGAAVMTTGAQRIDARRNMLLRCVKARRRLIVMAEAHHYLKIAAQAAMKQVDTLAKLKAEEAERKLREDEAAKNAKKFTFGGKAKQADIAVVYKIDKMRNMSIAYLLVKASGALKHCEKQRIVHQSLLRLAKKSKLHSERQRKDYGRLRTRALRAIDWCHRQDTTLMSLIRSGINCDQLVQRREEATAFLLRCGRNVLAADERRKVVLVELQRLGQGKLKWLNSQKSAVEYLTRRNVLATKLLARQKEAIEFLRQQSRGIFENEVNLQKAQIWLAAVGKRALQHCRNKETALQKLRFTAKKATFLLRRSTIALTDLTQIGQQARFKLFEFQYRSHPQKLNQIKHEKQRMQDLEQKQLKSRMALPPVERWRVELLDAFNFIANSMTPPVIEDRQVVHGGKLGNKRVLMGRVGFRKLVIHGKLFGAKEEVQALDEYFKTIDPLCTCMVPFEPVWEWFLRRAEIRDKYLQKQKKKPFVFTVGDILSIDERAVMLLYQLYGNDMDPHSQSPPRFVSRSPLKKTNKEDSDDDERPTSKKGRPRRRKAGWDDDSAGGDEELSEDSESVDDSLGDLDGDHFGDKDIGKLMRYLTRRDHARKEKEREEKEKAEREQKEKEEAAERANSLVEGASAESASIATVEPPEDSPTHAPPAEPPAEPAPAGKDI